ncbi:MAG: small multi-drug export protein [Archaeoglobales archaeon]|nr:small multi-drug export protein [Archaeoglobales archaeon]
MEIVNILLLSALPISELRGGIPLAIYYGLNPLTSYILCVAANIAPVPLILIILEKFDWIFKKIPIINSIYSYVIKIAEKRKKAIEKYGYLGLTIFVAIPAPVTGAWTASLIAFLMRLNKLKAFFYISAGVFIAGLIVTSATLGIFSIF